MGIACSSLHLLWHPIAKEITLKVPYSVGSGYEVSVSSFDRFIVNKHTRVGWLFHYMTVFNWENKPVGDKNKIITPHVQRERGKVIDRGVHMYICLWSKKKFESYFRDRLTFSNVDSRTSR